VSLLFVNDHFEGKHNVVSGLYGQTIITLYCQMRLLNTYARRILRKKAETISREVKLPHPDDIGKVGVLWQPSQKEAYLYLYNYFLPKKAIFRNLCINTENTDSSITSNVITSKDLNWLGLPKKGHATDFIKMEFDMLMNIALKQNIVLDYITALSNAKFKTGWSPDENNYFDLNIKINSKQDALYLAKQQIFYLRQLNIKTNI